MRTTPEWIRPRRKNKLAEISIRGDQQRAVLIGSTQYSVVVNTGIEFRNVEHGVAVRSQAGNDRPIHTLVSQEIHTLRPTVG